MQGVECDTKKGPDLDRSLKRLFASLRIAPDEQWGSRLGLDHAFSQLLHLPGQRNIERTDLVVKVMRN